MEKILSGESYPSEEDMQEALTKTLKNEYIFSCRERIRKVLELDISIETKYLFLYEDINKTEEIIRKLSKEEKEKILEELEKINMGENMSKLWIYSDIVKFCKEWIEDQ